MFTLKIFSFFYATTTLNVFLSTNICTTRGDNISSDLMLSILVIKLYFCFSISRITWRYFPLVTIYNFSQWKFWKGKSRINILISIKIVWSFLFVFACVEVWVWKTKLSAQLSFDIHWGSLTNPVTNSVLFVSACEQK